MVGTRASDGHGAPDLDATTTSPWSYWVDQACGVVAASGQWRTPRTFDALGPSGLLGGSPAAGGGAGQPEPVVSFASNDYLGLASHPVVVAAAREALDRWGSGSGASRLVTGTRPVHVALESELAAWKRCEAAVVFPTGFAANLSVLSVFATEGARVFSDELNHASIIDGCRLSRSRITVYPHGDLGRLDAALARSSVRPIIVSDTVFSMDGDAVDIEGLVDVAGRHRALLVLDEAHAVLGPELPEGAPVAGRGHTGRPPVDILRLGTLSKTLGSLGGFVAGPRRFVELLVNRARPYIFTTAPTPADSAAALAALGIVRSAEGDALRRRLAGLVARVAAAVDAGGHGSPIIPLIIGDEADAVAASTRLAARGLWVPAIRPPTVPAGTSRLRITLSAIHTDRQVDGLLRGLEGLGLGPTVPGRRPVPPVTSAGSAGSPSQMGAGCAS
jgi:8-amino-7-oxononanoate synthase